MGKFTFFLLIAALISLSGCPFIHRPADRIINHECTSLSSIPGQWIQQAREQLHIAYGHTSHGSQLVDGMTGLVTYSGGGSQYAWSATGDPGTLWLEDYYGAFGGSNANDLGNPDYLAWEGATRTYLAANTDVNVVIWSWCGQVSGSTEEIINQYLDLMGGLEEDFPAVTFVYMTGHLDGSGTEGNLNVRNQQIRDYCRLNDKWLYDFADIESYDPDGTVNYMELLATDACLYDLDGDDIQDTNWAVEWQNSHPGEWYVCGSAHSEPLNANRKAYAAWWLWARLAGWAGI
jgi:hypothetical protein